MRKTIQLLLIAVLLPAGWLAGAIKETTAPKTAPYQAFGEAETIRGSLVSLVEEQRLIVLKEDGGVPFNFTVTPATKIEIGGKSAGFEDLDAMTNAKISVTFVPMRQGNVARKVQIGQ